MASQRGPGSGGRRGTFRTIGVTTLRCGTVIDLSQDTCLPGLIDAHLDVRTAIQEGLFIGPRITGTDYVGFPVKQGVRELGSLVEAGRTVSAPSSRASLPTSFVMLGGRDVSPR